MLSLPHPSVRARLASLVLAATFAAVGPGCRHRSARSAPAPDPAPTSAPDPTPAVDAGPSHPLDSLTAEEYAVVVRLVAERAKGPALFPLIGVST